MQSPAIAGWQPHLPPARTSTLARADTCAVNKFMCWHWDTGVQHEVQRHIRHAARQHCPWQRAAQLHREATCQRAAQLRREPTQQGLPMPRHP